MRRRIIYISVTAAISLVLILLGIFVFTNSYLRLFESFKDFGTSIAFYFTQLFGIDADITPTVTKYSGIIPDNPEIPSTPTEAVNSVVRYIEVFISYSNFKEWLIKVVSCISMTALLILPCILLLILIIRFMYGRCNTRHNKDTIPLKVFKFASRVIYQPTHNAISSYFLFLRRHRWIIRIWLAVTALYLNFATHTLTNGLDGPALSL